MQTRLYALCLGLLLTGVFLSGCDPLEGDMEVPAYIKVERFEVIENGSLSFGPQNKGFLTSEIQDVWVFVDGKYCGAYPLPCSVPLLYEGRHEVRLEPGIVLNGISSTRNPYPFYTSVTKTVDLQPEKEISMDELCGGTLQVKYNDWGTFPIWEDFEGSGYHFENAVGQDTTIKVIKVESADTVGFGGHEGGDFVGAMYVNTHRKDYKMLITDSVVCTNYNGIILELDYWNNTPFEVGICGKASEGAVFRYVPAMVVKGNKATEKRGWNKIYIVLGKVWEQLGHTRKFKVYIRPFLNNTSEGWVYLDNIKLVHYK